MVEIELLRDITGEATVTKCLGKDFLEECLKNPQWKVIKYNGWKGVGRWKIAEEAAKIAMESHLFDILIRVKLSKEEWGPRNLQMSIAKHLRIELPILDGDSGMETDEDMAEAIRARLKDKTFLLLVGEVSKRVDLGWVGLPNMTRRRSAVATPISSKVVLIGNADNVMPFDRDFDFEQNYIVNFDDNSLSYTQVTSNLFVEETNDAVDSSLRSNFTLGTVMDCLMYLSLFNINIAGEDIWFKRYWMVQSIVNTSNVIIGAGEEEIGSTTLEEDEEEEEDILVGREIKSLLKELCDRSFIDEQHQVPDHIKNILRIVGPSDPLHKIWIDASCLPTPDYKYKENLRSIAITMSTRNSGSLPSSPRWPNLSFLVIICEPKLHQLDIPPCFFQYMMCLCVLDLRFAPITTLPSSISHLGNLRFLRLQGCKKLTAIPTSMQALEKLEFLDLSKCDSLEIIPIETFDRVSNLRVLDLSKSKIKSLPSSVSNLHSLQQLLLASCKSLAQIQEESFNCSMLRLQVLDFSGAASLESLPSSLCNLGGLKELNLHGCSSLKRIGLGMGVDSLRSLSELEVLDLYKCLALQQIQDVSFGDLVPNIKYINLSWMGATLKKLSFKGCARLEHLVLSDLNPEVLNLSGTTQLKKFFCDAIPTLRRLDLLPSKYNGIQDFQSQEFNWDDNETGARIWVSNADIFKNLSSDFFDVECFSRFHIRISSSTEEKPNMPMPMGNIQNIPFQSNQFSYKDVYSHVQARLFPNFRRTYNQHLEIFGFKLVSLRPLNYLLQRAELLTLFDNCSVKSLTEDMYSFTTISLKECRIASCQRMEIIFDTRNFRQFNMECLEVMWVSDLPKLTTVSKCDNYPRSFAFLKHMHLERCPKLSTVFTSGCYFEGLETLEIKFCSRLEVVFGDGGEAGGGSFQKLRSLCLWQLPKLESICSGYLPKLQKMRVGGCRKLRKLPLQARIINDQISYDIASDVGSEVEIEGEMNWWNNLQWEGDASSIKRPVRFRACGRVPVKQPK